ncbi:ribosomal large subunit pseudouridine synthase A [Betaproteobacteria bacterium]|nr:ribosomal large subunit pseudouridine synthase A [Betaproteobacteria bacterium]GHU41222.1 ribosomal large subunit pseudouridine synthase A [Betaproteobacteria bacterium]
MSDAPQLLYADDSLLALEKPSGMLSVLGRGEDKQDCLWSWATREFPDALIVHRLDMATSGIILLARGKAMQSALSRLFAERRVEKQYTAVVAGRLAASEGKVDLPLICDWPNRPRQRVSFEHGKSALTEFKRLNFEGEDRTRVLLLPYTGRSHQLRVHMQAIGHPILGDEFYAPPAARAAALRLLLHASQLSFAHPVSGREVALVSRAPF